MSGLNTSFNISNQNYSDIKVDLKKDYEKNIVSKTGKAISNNDILGIKSNTNLEFEICNSFIKENKKVEHSLDILGQLDSLKDKEKTVLGTSNFLPITMKDKFKDGSCQINYRFKTDIDKSTFDQVKEDKNYGKNKDFFYVNGIMTDEKAAKNTASELSKLTGKDVKPIHNETNGMLNDLLEVTIERLSDKTFDKVTQKTALNFYNTLASGKELKIIAHSQGAAITADALTLCREMINTKELFQNSAVKNKLKKSLESGNHSNITIENTSSKFTKSSNYKSEKFDLILDDNVKKGVDKNVDKIMSKVEVITMGGAASQDKFPNVKLVQVVNPKDPVPQVGGDDLIQTKLSRKTESVGKVSYVTNSKETNKTSNFLYNKNLQHITNGAISIVKNIPIAVSQFITGTNPIDYHLVDAKEDKEAYLHQNNVRSLIYNFGRRDF